MKNSHDLDLEKEVKELRVQIDYLTTSVNQHRKELASFQANENENKKEALERDNKTLKETNEVLKKEVETSRDDVAVESMLFSNFKERMKEKYLYDSEDEERDYEPDEEKREKSRELFRIKKQKERSMKNRCEKCDFHGKTPAGLKTHLRKKH